MATIRCPECGYSESDGRKHDHDVYPELCVKCYTPDRLAKLVHRVNASVVEVKVSR